MEPYDLSSVPDTHRVEERADSLKLSSDCHDGATACLCPLPHINKNQTDKQINVN